MKNIEYYLPIEWYIAKIDYYICVLKTIEPIHQGMHSGQQVYRIYYDGIKHHEVKPNSKHWEEVQAKYQRRLTITSEIKRLKKQLTNIYNTTYEKERPNYLITKNRNSKFNTGLYNQLTGDSCTKESKRTFEFDNHQFRSRIERDVAQIVKATGIPYKYECGIHLFTRMAFTDFTLGFPEFNRCVFLEIMGALDDQSYTTDNAEKFKNYSLAGYFIGVDLFILGGGSKSMPDQFAIMNFLIYIVKSLCIQYVQKIN